MADHFTEFALPDTDLARKAHALAFEIETPALANHSVRGYVFARALADARNLVPGSDYDDEVLFLACVLHDVGLTERGNGNQRFEVDGADLAADFLREQGLNEARARLVWEAIALHTSLGIADRMRAETALAHAGIGVDVTGPGSARLPEGLAERTHRALPRLEPGCGLAEAIVAQISRNPAKAPFGSLPYEIARQTGADAPLVRWEDLVGRAWPGVA